MLEWLLILVIVLGLMGAGVWLLRGYLPGGAGGALFGSTRERRIGVSDSASVDGRRKLLLIYRDGVEHLIMTGGPVDVVIEQNIQPQQSTEVRRHSYDRSAVVADPAEQVVQPASFGRVRPRAAGSAGNDGK